MFAKKLNAVLSLIASALLLEHILFSTSALFRMDIHGMPPTALAPLFITVALHALLSIGILIFATEGKKPGPYKKENRKLTLQRASAMAILVMIFVHAATYSIIDKGGLTGTAASVLKAALELAFTAFCLLHLNVSFRNAFISLGWVKTEKGARRIAKIMLILTLVVGLLAFAGIISFFIRRAL